VKRFGFKPGMFPVAERVGDRTLSLPLSAAMRDEEVERVVDALRRTLVQDHRGQPR